jgi:hypothetical protein
MDLRAKDYLQILGNDESLPQHIKNRLLGMQVIAQDGLIPGAITQGPTKPTLLGKILGRKEKPPKSLRLQIPLTSQGWNAVSEDAETKTKLWDPLWNDPSRKPINGFGIDTKKLSLQQFRDLFLSMTIGHETSHMLNPKLVWGNNNHDEFDDKYEEASTKLDSVNKGYGTCDDYAEARKAENPSMTMEKQDELKWQCLRAYKDNETEYDADTGGMGLARKFDAKYNVIKGVELPPMTSAQEEALFDEIKKNY